MFSKFNESSITWVIEGSLFGGSIETFRLSCILIPEDTRTLKSFTLNGDMKSAGMISLTKIAFIGMVPIFLTIILFVIVDSSKDFNSVNEKVLLNSMSTISNL